MLRQMLLNSTAAARDFDLMSNTHTPAPLNVSHGPVSVSALLKPTGRGSALREGEPDKPDLATYVVMCLVLFLLVLLIVFFINCQLRNSFFASMPYDRSLREARSSYKWPFWAPQRMQMVWITEPAADCNRTDPCDWSVYNDCFVLLHGLLCPYTVYHESCALCKRLFSCTMLNHD